MSTTTIAATEVELNDEGFFVDPEQWTEDMAPELARREGIDELTAAHWQVLRFMRSEYFAKGTGPTVRMLGKTSGVSVKELYQLFPKGPAKIAARIAGIPKPHAAASERNDTMSDTIEKVSIVISKGSLDGIYPGLIMANGARAEGIEANLFFTFFGLDAIHKARHEHIKMATVGNPGLHVPTMVGGLPGVSSMVTQYMNHKMEKLDIPSIPEFIEMIADTGAGLYACKASVDLFGLEKNDFIDQVQDIITVGEFYDIAAGGQIIFT